MRKINIVTMPKAIPNKPRLNFTIFIYPKISPVITINNSKIEVIICLLTKDKIIRAYKDGIEKEKKLTMKKVN